MTQRIVKAEVVTRREILVAVPDELEVVAEHGNIYILEPGSGVNSPRVLLSTTVALQKGLLRELEPIERSYFEREGR